MQEPLTLELLAELMPALGAAFPRSKLTNGDIKKTVETYRNGLNGFSGAAVRWAVKKVIQEDEFFPKVKRLRELASVYEAKVATAARNANRPVSFDECHICGVRATRRTIRRLKRDPLKRYALVLDEHKQPIWEEVESVMDYIEHDPVKHNVFPEREG